MRSGPPAAESLLKKGLDELSLDYSQEQITAFMTYLSELKKWNKVYNLTSLKTDEDIIIKHFLDSLLYLEAIPAGGLSVMDAGSGAGFPGIPLKIIRPEIGMRLLEPSRKKAAFLRHIIRVLGLQGVEVEEKRVEEIKSPADVVVTRALFNLRDFCRRAFPLLKEDGRLVVSKGPKVKEELETLKNLDFELLTTALPLSSMKRYIVVIRKAGQDTETEIKRSGGSVDGNRPEGGACVNRECRLRKAGCRGFEGCPGFKAQL
jgi:16S rRNA (guanine527-N7)-methyltransferase